MTSFDYTKYKPTPTVSLASRQWPDQMIRVAPKWCSVDLRDGNQALIEPMTVAQKHRLFRLLVEVGFKEIEVGFPAASSHDFDFVRELIEKDVIPKDVTIQVLCQARETLIEKTFAALKGARRVIMHVYNSTSTVQRKKVFDLEKTDIIDIAVKGAIVIKRYADKHPETEWVFQYSPESFTGTELDFSVEICNAVNNVWRPTREKPVILNLPATVEMTTPNVYADQIEWFCNNIDNRDNLIISLHTHNDRGCAVAAAELGVMAGADRVEGTLMGNGERTGNMDVMTMAMNLYSQGTDPGLDFSRMDEIIECYSECTQLPVHPRHPYAGDLVFTAFSGSHQDAIKKCLAVSEPGESWDIAYLPIDPADLGRDYEEVIRINSQSGKGGVAYVLEKKNGLQLPRWLQIEFSSQVQRYAEKIQAEVSAEQIWTMFDENYLTQPGNSKNSYQLENYTVERKGHVDTLTVDLVAGGKSQTLLGSGAGVVEAFIDTLQRFMDEKIVLIEYSEHALSNSAEAQAISYMQLNIGGSRFGGVSVSRDIVAASLGAILSAVNRAANQNPLAA